jgi:NDP-sugar pyrophosphorylase family protein
MIDTVCILAGGKATRLYPMTLKIPKSLIDINGKPFIIRQFEILEKNRICKAVLCLGFLGEMIEKYLSESEYIRNGFEVNYSYDSDVPPGTGGAILNALPLLPEKFWIMYGDSYIDVNFKEISEYYETVNNTGLMTVYKNQNLFDKSNVLFRNGLILKYHKTNITKDMEYIDYGLGILTKSGFKDFNGRFDLSEVYQKLLLKNELAGFEVKNRFYEIGSFEGIEELKLFLNQNVKQ